MYKVFLDTNVLLDYLCDCRGSVGVAAERLFDSALRGEIECYIAPHSLTNIFYIIRKFYNEQTRKNMIGMLRRVCKVQTLNDSMIEEALAMKDCDDFEDALQIVCARHCKADEFITRDKAIKSF